MSDKVYQIITDKIIERLEAGVVPWEKPWNGGALPQNFFSKNVYRGINAFLLGNLGETPYWATKKQITEKGGKVKTDETPTPIAFWKFIDKKNKDGEIDADGRKIPFLRYYSVYNLSQCDGLAIPVAEIVDNKFNPIKAADKIVKGFKDAPKIAHKGTKAFYSPANDSICMPPKKSFKESVGYYSVLFHELVHSTGHVNRVGRKSFESQIAPFGTASYSKEELVAEMGSAFLNGIAKIENENTLAQNAAYIKGWLSVLKSDNKFVVQAAGQAQKAADYILGTTFNN